MIYTNFARSIGQTAFLVSTILLSTNDASGLNVDPFAFCTNSCSVPGLCDSEANLKSQCKKVCSEEHIWKQAAKLQMSSSSRDFRMEKDAGKKDKMIYSSPLAKCLELTPKTEEPKPTPPPPNLPVPAAPTAPMKATTSKDDLCAAALKKAMADFESNKTALDHGKTDLEAQKQDIEKALKAHEEAAK